MMGRTNKHKFLLYFFFALYGAYYFADMQSSANVVVKQVSERTSVHYFMILMIIVLGGYLLFLHKIFVKDGFRTAILGLISCALFIDFVNNISFWSIATHIGLLVLFFLTSFFGSHYIDTKNKYQLVLRIEFILWCITLFYAIKAYFNYRSYMANSSSTPVLNMAYNMLVFLPILVQLKNKKIKTISILITVGYILLSLKRGAILALVGMIIVYWINMKEDWNFLVVKKRTLIVTIVCLISIIILAGYVDSITNGALSERFSLDSLRDGSNRNVIYSSAITEIKSRSLLRLIIGTGSGSTTTFIGSGAHNEVLEMMISYGFIGLIIYVLSLIMGIRHIMDMRWRNVNRTYVAVYAMSLFYIVAVGIFGSSLFSHMSFHIFLSMGLVCATDYYGLEETGA